MKSRESSDVAALGAMSPPSASRCSSQLTAAPRPPSIPSRRRWLQPLRDGLVTPHHLGRIWECCRRGCPSPALRPDGDRPANTEAAGLLPRGGHTLALDVISLLIADVQHMGALTSIYCHVSPLVCLAAPRHGVPACAGVLHAPPLLRCRVPGKMCPRVELRWVGRHGSGSRRGAGAPVAPDTSGRDADACCSHPLGAAIGVASCRRACRAQKGGLV